MPNVLQRSWGEEDNESLPSSYQRQRAKTISPYAYFQRSLQNRTTLALTLALRVHKNSAPKQSHAVEHHAGRQRRRAQVRYAAVRKQPRVGRNRNVLFPFLQPLKESECSSEDRLCTI